MINIEAMRDTAAEALERGEYEAAITAADALVAAGEPWVIDGLVRRAMALESWAEGPPGRLIAAANDWRRMIEIAPAAIAHQTLARILLKLGDREAAFANLLEAERRGPSPEVLLGFAQFHRTASPPDLERAKAYFRRAALRCRTQGMRGYVEIAYELGQPYRAWAMVSFGLIATPFLALVLGARRHSGF
jgi:tetratricopeptide (TPR) repeat protein